MHIYERLYRITDLLFRKNFHNRRGKDKSLTFPYGFSAPRHILSPRDQQPFGRPMKLLDGAQGIHLDLQAYRIESSSSAVAGSRWRDRNASLDVRPDIFSNPRTVEVGPGNRLSKLFIIIRTSARKEMPAQGQLLQSDHWDSCHWALAGHIRVSAGGCGQDEPPDQSF